MQQSVSKKRPYQSISLGVMDRRGDVQSSSATTAESQGHLCRPWDRADFMRRLATFKSISWFAKPKVLSGCPCSIFCFTCGSFVTVYLQLYVCEEIGLLNSKVDSRQQTSNNRLRVNEPFLWIDKNTQHLATGPK